jgi:hypothetical protein
LLVRSLVCCLFPLPLFHPFRLLHNHPRIYPLLYYYFPLSSLLLLLDLPSLDLLPLPFIIGVSYFAVELVWKGRKLQRRRKECFCVIRGDMISWSFLTFRPLLSIGSASPVSTNPAPLVTLFLLLRCFCRFLHSCDPHSKASPLAFYLLIY